MEPVTPAAATEQILDDLFIAQADRPAHLQALDLASLTPFQRALLVIDGTVTQFLEAYTMEPVETLRIDQQTQDLDADHPWLQASSGAPTVSRHVLMRGVHSGVEYARADSLLVWDRLPPVLQNGLQMNGESMGRLLLRSQLETRREMLWYGVEAQTQCICRTYRILAGGKPLTLISEHFPLHP